MNLSSRSSALVTLASLRSCFQAAPRGVLAAGALLLALVSPSPTSASNPIGLSAVRSLQIENFALGDDLVETGERFGHTFAVGDFNGDGVDDLATGIPYDDGNVNVEQDIGAVYVRLGVAGSGLHSSAGDFMLSQEVGPNLSFDDEHFGWALAAGDFNGDAIDDLAVGVPQDKTGTAATGAVQIYYGPLTPGVQHPGVVHPGLGTAGDRFGEALTVGNFDGDAYDDLAVGAPGRVSGAGAVVVIYGTAGGLDPGAQMIQQSDPDVEDVGEPGDWFGYALAAGDWNGDGRDDLAVGVPKENAYGAVQLFFGSDLGLDLVHDLFWTQNSIAGTSETGDQFGFALGSGDFDGDGHCDLAIGSPGEAYGASNEITNSGMVVVTYGSVTGFDLGRTQGWTQFLLYGSGADELGDRFGAAFASGDFDGDLRADLAIGQPEEDVSGFNDGALTVILGSPTGLTAGRSRLLAAGVGGFPGQEQANSNYGFAAVSGDFDHDGYDDLVIGIPYHDHLFTSSDSGAAVVLYGSLFADGFAGGGVGDWVIPPP